MLDLVNVALSVLLHLDPIFYLVNQNGILQIIRLARKLPTGEVSALRTDATEEHEEPLDENDLT